ncbi:auxin-responsive protein IAA27-like [Coffea eugenioides]|uniref:Auxin-responsive protein n=1 Tax=Coffea arabica TaxID=13443 RepID=A0ABM4U7D9_COFAR|nr:auxin-responsive protein IAA27-like [Coffea arabica]XP_027168319.1 auxin-responsive protein IAA27-like [Coffea eugenioides]
MSPPQEQYYIGLSEASSVERNSDKISSSSSSSSNICPEDEGNNALNLKETELRLGLPGSQSPERKAGHGVSLFGKDLEEKTSGFKSCVSGAKRGFSDAIDGSGKWDLRMKVSSDVSFGKTEVLFSPGGGKDGASKNINTLQSCLPGLPGKEAGAPPAAKPVEEKNTSSAKDHGSSPASKAQVVGWPPIRSFRKNTLATNLSKNSDAEAKSGPSCLYVKVSMDGAPYLRKVDLKTYCNYAELSSALEKMFSCFTIGQCTSNGLSEQEGLNERGLKDLLHDSEHVLTYEDKDGDWMLVGDVPWEMFICSCKRLRIMRGSEAIGLAPRAMQKFKNQS